MTLGAVALAGAADAISALTPGRDWEAAYAAVLRTGGSLVPVAAALVTVVRRHPGPPPAAVGGDGAVGVGPEGR